MSSLGRLCEYSVLPKINPFPPPLPEPSSVYLWLGLAPLQHTKMSVRQSGHTQAVVKKELENHLGVVPWPKRDVTRVMWVIKHGHPHHCDQSSSVILRRVESYGVDLLNHTAVESYGVVLLNHTAECVTRWVNKIYQIRRSQHATICKNKKIYSYVLAQTFLQFHPLQFQMNSLWCNNAKM